MNIEFRAVSKRFGDNKVLDHINISLPEGQPSCLMGPSGSGKTTIINILMGLLPIDSGEVIGLKNRRIAGVFQEDRLIEHWDAIKNISLVCDKSVTKEQIKGELQQVGLEEELDRYQDKPVSLFSGGMRRRVAIVRAVLAQSEFVILDEPFKGLDDALKQQVIDYVKQKTAGKTVLLVTHDKEEARQLGGKLILLQPSLFH